MAAPVGLKQKDKPPSEKHRLTSIGKSVNTRPKNKSAKRNHKPYRGQG